MRIAVWHNLPSGGGKRALHDHVRELVARGHDVDAFCPPTADRKFLPLADMITENVVPLGRPEPVPLRILVRAGLRSDLYGRLRTMDHHCQKVADIVGTDADVFFANSSRSLRVPPIGRHVKVRSVLYLQEPSRKMFEAQPELPWVDEGAVQRRGWRAVVRAQRDSLAAFDRVLVNSYYSRESVLRAYGVDATVCYLGVDTERFSPAPTRAMEHLVGIGNIAPGKNIEFVIEALAKTAGAATPRLVWIGNTERADYANDLRQRAARTGVDLDLRVDVSDVELVDLLRRASALVYAPRLEPFGYAPLEANACGIPVVAVAEGGVRETVEDGVTGFLVPPDWDAFAAAVTRLTTEPELNCRLGSQGRSIVEQRWSLEGAGDRIERMLADITDTGVTGSGGGSIRSARRPADAPGRRPTSVSVVIPVKDAGATLSSQLEALSGQSVDEPFEVIVADNGSTDDSVTGAEAWTASFASFRVLDASAVPGQSHARNAGVRVATGELLAFCDADDVVHRGWLEALVEASVHHHVVGGRLDASGNDPRSAAWYEPLPVDRLPAKAGAPPVAVSANMAIWRETFEALGGFDERIAGFGGEETDLCFRAHLAGFATGFAADAVIDYRYRNGIRARLRQAWREGVGEAVLEARFGGVLLPEHTAARTLRRTGRLLRAAPGMLRRRHLRGRWLARAFRLAGMTAGRARRHPAALLPPQPRDA